jgi:hypothetical protein
MMKPSTFRSLGLLCVAAILAGGSSLAARADAATPDPCKLITVTEMQQIVGPLDGTPKRTNPSYGEVNCSYTPAKGPSFIDISLVEGDLADLRRRAAHKNAISLPDFGKDAFVNPNFHDFADMYAKKGNLILRVTLPMGPTAVDTAQAIAKKALTRL